ncbi:MAG: DUF2207 domain-containing protein [Candidatus Paceibacterota bacterium]
MLAVTAVVCGAFVAPLGVTAGSHEYSSIHLLAEVTKDSRVAFRELQTVSFAGSGAEYVMQRRIPLAGVSEITDVVVVDAATGERLERLEARRDLDQDLDRSPDAGRDNAYTVYPEDDDLVIEWYHRSADTQRRWVISYVAHGAVHFSREFNELTWTVLSGYDAPVRQSVIVVDLPGSAHPNDIQSKLEKDPASIESTKQVGRGQVSYIVDEAPAGATIAVSIWFPGDLVDRGAFWRWWLGRNSGLVGALLGAGVAVGVGFILWRRSGNRRDESEPSSDETV